MASRGGTELRRKQIKREQDSDSHFTPRPTSSTRSDTESTSGIFSDVDECQKGATMSYKNEENAKAFFRGLEKKHNSPLPEYIKNLLFLNGFASPVTFAAITEEDFGAMERMCRQEMLIYCPHTPDFFSFFFQCIEHFKIPMGHRKQLMSFIESTKGGLSEGEGSRGVKRKFKDTPSEPQIVSVNVREDPLLREIESPDFSIGDYPEIVDRVRRQIQRGLAGNTSCKAEELKVIVRMDGDISGAVECPVCSAEIKLSTDYRRKDKYGISLLSSSNFIRHVKRHTADEESGSGDPKKKKAKSTGRTSNDEDDDEEEDS